MLMSTCAPRPRRSRARSAASTPCAAVAPATRSASGNGTGSPSEPTGPVSSSTPPNACTAPSVAGNWEWGPSDPNPVIVQYTRRGLRGARSS